VSLDVKDYYYYHHHHTHTHTHPYPAVYNHHGLNQMIP
jgi:hypothetical protein